MDTASRSHTTTPLLGALIHPSQTRSDLWNSLRGDLGRHVAGPDAALADSLRHQLERLGQIERLWVYPGRKRVAELQMLSARGEMATLAERVSTLARRVAEHGDAASLETSGVKYFTVVFADNLASDEAQRLHVAVEGVRQSSDEFAYDVLVVRSLEEALLACTFNDDVQACVIGEDLSLRADTNLAEAFPGFAARLEAIAASSLPRSQLLARELRTLRPTLDRYLMSETSVTPADEPTADLFRRVFYRYEALHELHVTLLDGVRARYRAPFFDALREYAQRPIGNFHALPIARGHSVFSSRWIEDFGEFYGRNIFMAESSSTSGGLDSLLEPTGTLREAQDAAARAWGSERTFFVTNGTSTANKIVVQALCAPGDIVVIDRNCHKSHHYGMVLSGAHPVYLDAYPLEPLAIYGGVPLREIKRALLELKRAGRLDAVKMVLLTNCTFDGIVYNPRRVMRELLAIKPDLCFLWDEAWYAFATFVPTAQQRTAMHAAQQLEAELRSSTYRSEYERFRARHASLDPKDDATWLNQELLPDPDRVRIRVYSTHSTHKSLSAFRQGSMIHVRDEEFERRVADAFSEAYLTHTSTSPNYQILASLDIARRQVELEGYGLVRSMYQHAIRAREHLAADPLLAQYFRVLDVDELVPDSYRRSGFAGYVGTSSPQHDLGQAWTEDEFVLDPSRLTLHVGATGMGGSAFKATLMNELGIQVNKTSLNSVLLITTIGVTWGSLAFLLDGLKRHAMALAHWQKSASPSERVLFEHRVEALTREVLPLPDFSGFHEAFQPAQGSPEGDMRTAFLLGEQEENRTYVPLRDAMNRLDAGEALVSTNLVVPYPPGFPILVPGQLVSREILSFMQQLDVKEVHGYRASLGLSVFNEAVVGRAGAARSKEAERRAGNGRRPALS